MLYSVENHKNYNMNISAIHLKKIHPLFFIALALMLGISWHTITKPLTIPMFTYYLITVFIINIAIALYMTKKRNLMIPVLCAATFFLGTIIIDHQQKKYEQLQPILHKKNFDAQGIVQAITPQPHLRTPYRITFNILKVKKNNWLSINATIYIYLQSMPDIKVGDTLYIKNITCNKLTSNSFKQYLIKEKIAGTFFSARLDFEHIYRPTISFARWLHTKKENILHSLHNKLSKNTFPLFSSLFLGNKTQCKKELETTTDQFKTWGISHYLARSGLHLIVFILLWELILRFIPITFWIKQFIMLLLSLLYFLLSWPSLSFMRALNTFILYKCCILFKKQTHFIHLLTIVCFITLLLNPIQLLFLDFQLSFALTFALAYFNHIAHIIYKTTNYL